MSYDDSILCFDVGANVGHLKKSALILCEGTWKDSKGNFHKFTPQRLQKIVDRTNDFYKNGKTVGIYKDHVLTTDSKVGDYEGDFTIRQVKPKDVNVNKHPGLRDLIGKYAIFADSDNIILKDGEVIEKYKKGLVKTISPGLSQVTDAIVEISLTPKPAMPYATLFMEGGGGTAGYTAPINWEQIEEHDKEFDEKQKSLDKIYAQFLNLCRNIANNQGSQASDELLKEAIAGLAHRFSEELGVTIGKEPISGGSLYGNKNLERYEKRMGSLLDFARQADAYYTFQERGGRDITGVDVATGLAGLGATGYLAREYGKNLEQRGLLNQAERRKLLTRRSSLLRQRKGKGKGSAAAEALDKEIKAIKGKLKSSRKLQQTRLSTKIGDFLDSEYKKPTGQVGTLRKVGRAIVGKTPSGTLARLAALGVGYGGYRVASDRG